MKGQGYRQGYLAAGVLAVSVIAFGWTTQWAPARDANTPKAEGQWLSDAERLQAAGAVMEKVRAEGLPESNVEDVVRVSPTLHAPVDKPGFITTDKGETVRLITSYEASPIDGGGLATGGGVANGGACTCDTQCMAAAGECRRAHCVGGFCVQEIAPVDTTCAFDGNFCTEDRCNDAGICVDTRAAIGSATRLSPCAKQCCSAATCTNATESKQNCFDAGDCPGTEGCFPKIQVDGGVTYRVKCDETLDRCLVDANTNPPTVGTPVGRCCSPAGACTDGVTEAVCTGGGGRWLRWRDADDSLHACNATLGCPKYSSGIAPDGPHVTGMGPIVPFARRCAIGGGLCEVDADCIDRCNAGANAGESCDVDADCPGGLCVAPGGVGGDDCVADPDECQGGGTFTSIGDDYSLSNGSYMRLSEFRFRGGSRESNEVALFEFYDNAAVLVNAFAFRFLNSGDFDYRIIVDCAPNCDASQPQGSPGEEEPSDPPFIIPPSGFVVMRATQVGFALSPVSRQFGEDDGNLFWYSTDAADVGTNNANSMWVNGVIGNSALAQDILSFELLGEKLTNPPTAACCNPATGACTDTLQWNCAFCTDPARTPCQRGRDCGLNNEFRCTSKDWKGARTAAQVDNDAYRDCTSRYCFNPQDPNPASLTPCTGMNQGTCVLGQTCESPCEKAACCTPGGCIEVTSAGACTGPGTTLLGFGQKCTPNCCPSAPTGVDCCKDYYSCHTSPTTDTGNACNFRCSNNLSRQCTEDFDCEAPGTCTVLPNTQADCPGGQTCRLVCDGPNNNADPRIHAIDVPTYVDGSEQITVNFNGVTNPATFFDDCALGGADFGWYEIFSIGKVDANDACAVATLNFCCSEPVVTPVNAAIGRSCPCAGGETIFADNNTLGQQAGFGSTCNNDFCCTDGNFSVQWTLPAGTYVYGIVADKSCSNSTDACFQDDDCDPGTWCRRNNSSYLGHIVVSPCAPGACCGEPQGAFNHCSVVDKFTCQNSRKYCKSTQNACDDNSDCPLGDTCLPGVFLGDKEVSPVPLCDGDPCTLGACCVGPGNCQDAAGAGINFANCNAQNGIFLGGFRCTENPCPVCPIETQDQCQTATTGQFILPSDRILGMRRADDFKPSGTTIRRICWFPCFIGVTGTTQGFECTATPPPDLYIAKFYDDDNGKPGLLLPGQPGAGLALTVDAKLNSDVGGGSRCWRYTAPILPPAGLTVPMGDCLWIEVTGLGEAQQGGICLQHVLSSADGNNYSMRDVNNSYGYDDFTQNDIAFCIDSGINGASSPPLSQDGGCGNFPVACCRPGACLDGGTYTQCVGTNQAPILGFPFPFVTCAQLAGMGGCPSPANDTCANAAMPATCMNQTSNPNLGVCSISEGPPNIMEVCDMTIGTAPRHDCANTGATCQPRPASTDAYRCQFVADNRLATTDGPNMSSTACFSSGVNSFQADIWYKYTAPCTGDMTVHNCGPNKTYDSMLIVYSAGTPACVGCGAIDNTIHDLACSDDNCGSSSSGSAVRVPITAGHCYTIRMGGWSQLGSLTDAGQAVSGLDIGVVCDPILPIVPPMIPPAPDNRTKNRYVSFAPNNGATPVAFRVSMLPIAPNVAYPAGSPGGTCWVQAPVQTANPIPAQNVQYTAQCGPTPVFRVWNEPVVHIGDCEIIPAATYEIRTNGVGPIENPTPLTLLTAPIPTANGKKWGDNVGVNNGVEWTAPNLFTNVQDVLSLQAIINNSAIKPSFSVANMQATSASDSCLNASVNTADVLIIVQAIAGNSYGPPNTTKIVNPTLCGVCP